MTDKASASQFPACKDGIGCTKSTCRFAHPSKSLVCKNLVEISDDKVSLVEYIVQKLQNTSSGILPASQLGTDINKRAAWAAEIKQAHKGKLKLFCLKHPDKLKWINSGPGQVQLVKTGSIPIGAQVNITTKDPTYGWGKARCWSVGTVQSFTGSTYKVDFPEVKGWTGDERDLTISPNGLDRSTTDIGIVDLNFNKFGFVRNKGCNTFEFSGAGLQVGGRGLWEYGFVQGSKNLTQSCFYF
jgi:hypothetical protein